MPTFRYRAVDPAGRPARGELDAANESDLELRLKRMNLDLVTCRGATAGAGFQRRVSRAELINFCFHMEQIAHAGISFLEGLRDLREAQDSPRFREILTAVTEDLEGGKLLSQALAAHPRVFDSVFLGLTRAGEQTDSLAEVFASLGAALKWQDEIRAQTRRLLIYPLVVLSVVTLAIVFLLIFLVPQVVTLLQSMRVELPLQTRVLIAVSAAFTAYWPLFLTTPVLAGAGLWAYLQSNERARTRWDGLKLRLPLIGPVLQRAILARFANFFALMYRSGITVLEALRISEGVVANRAVAAALARAGGRIAAGDGLTESFQNLKLFPPLVIRMLKVGETTGALDAALLNITYFYNREIKEGVERALKLLEPALTVLLGLVMAFIIAAVLMPVWDLLRKLPV